MTMSIIEKAKRKMAQLEGNGIDIAWRPPEGETKIRFLPDADYPFLERHIHYRVNGKSFLCPRRNPDIGGECPVCDYVSNLWEDNPKRESPMWKKAVDLGAKKRYYSRVLVRGHESFGAVWFNFNKTLYEQLLKALIDEDMPGDFTDPVSGYDWKVTYVPRKGANYAKTTLTPMPQSICEALPAKDLKKVMANLPELEEVGIPIVQLDYEEIDEALRGAIGIGRSFSESKNDADAEKMSSSTDKTSDLQAKLDQFKNG